MSTRRHKALLRNAYLKKIQEVKHKWPLGQQYDQISRFPRTVPDTQLDPGLFYPVESFVTNILLPDEDTSRPLPGERVVLSLPSVHLMWPDGAETIGTLQVSNYRLVFVTASPQPPNPNPFSTEPHKQSLINKGTSSDSPPVYRPLPRDIVIPIHCIEKIEHDPKQKVPITHSNCAVMYFDVICKDVREYRLGMPKLAEGMKVLQLLHSYAFDEVYHHLYAFCLPKGTFYQGQGVNPDSSRSAFIDQEGVSFPFKPSATSLTLPLPPHLDGWRFYDPKSEYKRMGLPNEHFRISTINQDYSFCPTYPNTLVIPVSNIISDIEYRAVGKFRSKSRAPALSWKNPNGDQTIWRCSQPATGIGFNRCFEDEKMIEFIGKANASNSCVTIVDCRPRTNAYANNVKGFGSENESNYITSQVKFMNIENIHEVRKAYKKLRKFCLNANQPQQQSSLDANASLWLKYIQDILKATSQVVSLIDLAGQSVVIHCSDGWDRTSQLVSLVKLCLDPFYRTIRGFTILIEHDWLSFGHKFHDRYGHFSATIQDERSPIFLQWLDCVFQLVQQFPRHFEFTSEFLYHIAHHSFSGRFGTFLMNCERERQIFQLKPDLPPQKIADVTVSLWTYMFTCPAAVTGHFYNGFYSVGGYGNPKDLHRDFLGLMSPNVFVNNPQTNNRSTIAGHPPIGFSEPGHENIEKDDPNAMKVTRSADLRGEQLLGTTLYPSYNIIKLQLWNDFFMRHTIDMSNDYYHYFQSYTGNIYPGGATTAAHYPTYNILNHHMQWSQTIAANISFQLAQQQHSYNHLLQQQHRADGQLAHLVTLLSEKDALLRWYQENHGVVPEAEQVRLLTMVRQEQEVKQKAIEDHIQRTGSLPNDPTVHPLGSPSVNGGGVAVPSGASSAGSTAVLPSGALLIPSTSSSSLPAPQSLPVNDYALTTNGSSTFLGPNRSSIPPPPSSAQLSPPDPSSPLASLQDNPYLHRASYCRPPPPTSGSHSGEYALAPPPATIHGASPPQNHISHDDAFDPLMGIAAATTSVATGASRRTTVTGPPRHFSAAPAPPIPPRRGGNGDSIVESPQRFARNSKNGSEPSVDIPHSSSDLDGQHGYDSCIYDVQEELEDEDDDAMAVAGAAAIAGLIRGARDDDSPPSDDNDDDGDQYSFMVFDPATASAAQAVATAAAAAGNGAPSNGNHNEQETLWLDDDVPHSPDVEQHSATTAALSLQQSFSKHSIGSANAAPTPFEAPRGAHNPSQLFRDPDDDDNDDDYGQDSVNGYPDTHGGSNPFGKVQDESHHHDIFTKTSISDSRSSSSNLAPGGAAPAAGAAPQLPRRPRPAPPPPGAAAAYLPSSSSVAVAAPATAYILTDDVLGDGEYSDEDAE